MCLESVAATLPAANPPVTTGTILDVTKVVPGTLVVSSAPGTYLFFSFFLMLLSSGIAASIRPAVFCFLSTIILHMVVLSTAACLSETQRPTGSEACYLFRNWGLLIHMWHRCSCRLSQPLGCFSHCILAS